MNNTLNGPTPGPAADPANWTPVRLDSERVILAAPMSLTGSTTRIWRLLGERGAAWWSRSLWITGAVLALLVAWSAVLCWYCLFGLLLVPYRIIRRIQRHGRRNALRHRETLGS
jgi:4-hydroxybenzoate polyprenyltransferase